MLFENCVRVCILNSQLTPSVFKKSNHFSSCGCQVAVSWEFQGYYFCVVTASGSSQNITSIPFCNYSILAGPLALPCISAFVL
jgi:hypothetical protein